MSKPDMVNHPRHYNQHPKGIETIDYIAHMDFCCGNAIKYISRSEHKGNQIQDLEKAIWYLNYKITELKGQENQENQENQESEESDGPHGEENVIENVEEDK